MLKVGRYQPQKIQSSHLKLWGSARNTELSLWSNKISAENFKKYVTLIGRKVHPRYSKVMVVSGCSSLIAVNSPWLEWRIFELTDRRLRVWVRHFSRACTRGEMPDRVPERTWALAGTLVWYNSIQYFFINSPRGAFQN